MALAGVSCERWRWAYVSQGNPGNPVMDFRIIVNYELDLL